MTRPGIEPQSSGPLANTLIISQLLNILNDKNYQASSQKFRQIIKIINNDN